MHGGLVHHDHAGLALSPAYGRFIIGLVPGKGDAELATGLWASWDIFCKAVIPGVDHESIIREAKRVDGVVGLAALDKSKAATRGPSSFSAVAAVAAAAAVCCCCNLSAN